MKRANGSSRWLLLVAVGNVLLLVALAAGVWWFGGGQAGSTPVGEAPPPFEPLSVQAPPIDKPPPPRPGTRKVLPRPPEEELVIDLDGEGKIRLAGEPMELGVLRMRLCQLHADYRKRVVVTIRASDDCLFRHIKDVMNACDECVITTYHFSAPPVPNNLSRPGLNDTSAV